MCHRADKLSILQNGDCRSYPVQSLRSVLKGAHLLPETPGFYSPVTDCNLPAGFQFHNHRLSRKHNFGSRLCPALHPAGAPPLRQDALPYPRKPAPPYRKHRILYWISHCPGGNPDHSRSPLPLLPDFRHFPSQFQKSLFHTEPRFRFPPRVRCHCH